MELLILHTELFLSYVMEAENTKVVPILFTVNKYYIWIIQNVYMLFRQLFPCQVDN